MPRKIIVLAPGLVGASGSHAALCAWLVRECAARSLDCSLYRPSAGDVGEGNLLCAKPVFRVSTHARASRDALCAELEDYLVLNELFYQDLAATVPVPVAGDLILALGTDHLLTQGLCRWYAALPEPSRPFLAVLFDRGWENGVPQEKRALFLAMHRLALRSFASWPKARLFSFSRHVANAVSLVSGAPCALAPLPLDQACFSPGTPPLDPGVPPRIGFIGQGLEERGFHLMPDLIEADAAGGAAFRWLVHDSLEEPAQDVQARLASLGDRLVFSTGALDVGSWVEMARSLDLLLLPYLPERYSCRFSHSLAAAANLGLPVALPGKSGLEREAKALGCAYEPIEGCGVRPCLEALGRLRANIRPLRELAVRTAARLAPAASRKNLLDVVFKALPAADGPARSSGCDGRAPLAGKRPKVVVDGVFFQFSSSGIARTWETLLRIWAREDFGRNLVLLDRNGTAPNISGLPTMTVPAYDYALAQSDKALLQDICDRERASLFISTYYTAPLATPSLFFGYDMIPEVMRFDLSAPVWMEKHNALLRASALAAISRNTLNDMLRLFPSKAQVPTLMAHCGVDRKAFHPASEGEVRDFLLANGLDRPFFIVSGFWKGYKNGEFFCAALRGLENSREYVVLHTGVDGPDAHMQALLPETRIVAKRFSDQELRCAYTAAAALAYPSLYEGFGLPVIEAMACGCPVIACPVSSIPEVAGDAAWYVTGRDPAAMAQALAEVQKSEVRASLVARGLARAELFPWRRMADAVKGFIRELHEKTLPS